MEQVVRHSYPTVLVDGRGNFNPKIEEHLKLAAESRPLAVLSIIGVQSTGKSTFMNQSFGTAFKVMDATEGMHQTTKGIWVEKCQSPNGGHEILVIDTEGSDGAEREGDTKFEKQNALFALAVSNTVIINIKCDSINLNNGASRPLLQIVFEAMIRKFTTPHKVNLVFALRDKNKCPLNKLEELLKAGLHKLWKEMTKPHAKVNAALQDYFNIKVVAMSNYEEEPEQFQKEVAVLREWVFSNSTSGEAGAGRTPASYFAEYAKKIWDDIKEDKDLDLPSFRILVAELSCNRIAQEKYQSFCENMSWIQMVNDVKSQAVVQGFGERVSELIDTHISQYNEETQLCDDTKRDEIGKQLIEKVLKVVKPIYVALVERMRQAIRENFEKEAMDELKRTGVLVALMSQKFVNELRNQLREAVIRQANWNQTTEQLTRLESEIACYTKAVRDVNELLEKKRRDRRKFWLKVAAVGGCVLLAAGVVGTLYFQPAICVPIALILGRAVGDLAKAALVDLIIRVMVEKQII